MTILVCGSRNWTDHDLIRRELEQLPAGSVIIHGDNGYDAQGKPLWGQPDELAVRGADKLAGTIARELGLSVETYTPDWQRYGNSAGPRRNTRMLQEGKPQLVLAFTADLAASRGTRDMVTKARAAGVEVRIIPTPSRVEGLSDGQSVEITVTKAQMTASALDALPDFEGY